MVFLRANDGPKSAPRRGRGWNIVLAYASFDALQSELAADWNAHSGLEGLQGGSSWERAAMLGRSSAMASSPG